MGSRNPLEMSEGARPARHDDAHGGGTPPHREHKGWYVPRALPQGIVQAITFRLADALPRVVVAARRDEGDAAHRCCA
jgi:hypothetical protein